MPKTILQRKTASSRQTYNLYQRLSYKDRHHQIYDIYQSLFLYKQMYALNQRLIYGNKLSVLIKCFIFTKDYSIRYTVSLDQLYYLYQRLVYIDIQSVSIKNIIYSIQILYQPLPNIKDYCIKIDRQLLSNIRPLPKNIP